jgi:hypothetical protein
MKPIVLIGRAICWSSGLEEIKKLCPEFDVMAVGMDCPYEGEVQYLVTYHYKDIKEYIKKRKKNGLSTKFLSISHVKKTPKNILIEEVDIVEPHKDPSGSSSLLGTAAAIRLGYQKIILCGCPLEGRNQEDTRSYNHFQRGWEKRREEVINYTRSMSGWTKIFLGYPTKEWLND